MPGEAVRSELRRPPQLGLIRVLTMLRTLLEIPVTTHLPTGLLMALSMRDTCAVGSTPELIETIQKDVSLKPNLERWVETDQSRSRRNPSENSLTDFIRDTNPAAATYIYGPRTP